MKKIYILLITLLLCFEGWGQTFSSSFVSTQMPPDFSYNLGIDYSSLKIDSKGNKWFYYELGYDWGLYKLSNGNLTKYSNNIFDANTDNFTPKGPSYKSGVIFVIDAFDNIWITTLQDSSFFYLFDGQNWKLFTYSDTYYDYFSKINVKQVFKISDAALNIGIGARPYYIPLRIKPNGNVNFCSDDGKGNILNYEFNGTSWVKRVKTIKNISYGKNVVLGQNIYNNDVSNLSSRMEFIAGNFDGVSWYFYHYNKYFLIKVVGESATIYLSEESLRFVIFSTDFSHTSIDSQNNLWYTRSDMNLVKFDGNNATNIVKTSNDISTENPQVILDNKNNRWFYSSKINNQRNLFKIEESGKITILSISNNLIDANSTGRFDATAIQNKTSNIYGYFKSIPSASKLILYSENTIQPTLTLSATEQNAVATATTSSITLTTNNTWTTSSNATWLKVSPASGNAGTNIPIKFAIDANTAATARTGVVTFTSGGLTKTYTVTQAGTNGTGLNIDRGINIISPKTNDYFFAANYIPVKAELKESTLGVGFKVGLYPSGSDVPIETTVKVVKISQLSDFTLDLPSTLLSGKYEIRIVNFSNNSINGKVQVEMGNKPDECASQPLNIVNSRKGITIITHGFTPGGEKYGDISSWTDYAKKIRKKISSSNYLDGKGAVIYKNNNDTGIWEKMKIPANEGGNGNVTFDNNGNIDNEIILIYDWKGYSHKPLLPFVAETGIQSGYLEAAADNLFRLLVDSHSDDGKLTSKNIIEKLPVHIIAHSRGNIMILQTLHRIGKYFPKILIEQFTTLDPHPATSFGDVAYKQAGTVSSLPGLTSQIVDGCKNTIGCSNSMDIQLQIPSNIKYAENYFRRDGIYEGGINISSSAYYNLNFKIFAGSFDGIPVNGINTNNELDEGKIAIYSDILGGSHSGVVNWYFGTLNSENINKDEALNKRNVIDWYGAKGALKNNPKCRFSSGYYFSRNGGASDSEMSNLKPFKTISIDEMDKQLEKRPRCYNDNCTSKPLTYLGILNGNFEYGNNSGWWGNGGDMSNETDKQKQIAPILNTDNTHNYALNLGDITGVVNKYSATHSSLYFPTNFNYLEMSIFMYDDLLSKSSTENIFKVTFYDKFYKEYISKTVKIPADNLWHKYSFEIPNELKGKSGRFKVELVSNKLTTNFINSNHVLVDNIQFGNIKQSGVVINENSSKSLTLFPNPTNNQFSIDLKDIEGKAQSLTIIDEKGTIIAQKAVDETCCENIQVDFPQTGVYSIIIQTDKGTVSKKLSVNK